MAFSILWNDVSNQGYTCYSSLFEDLNFDQVLFALSPSGEDRKQRLIYEKLMRDRESIVYRQDVLKELDEKDSLKDAMSLFCSRVNRAVDYVDHVKDLSNELSIAHWKLLSLNEYFCAIDQLLSALNSTQVKAEGLNRLKQKCTDVLDEERNKELKNKVYELCGELDKLSISLQIEKDHIQVLPKIQGDDFIKSFFEKYPDVVESYEQMDTLLPGSLESDNIEKAILKLIKKKKNVFSQMKTFQTKEYSFDQEILSFSEQVKFYVYFLKYVNEMRKSGYKFTCPELTDEEFSIQGGYDLALAQKNIREKKITVVNDYYFDQDEKFIIITGPNQGGKTTLARSMGQLVMMTLLGLYVPASSARLPIFSGVYTHFAKEESMESGSGKLKSELEGLKRMLDQNVNKGFVIFNELFTSAANYDAQIMGQKMLKTLMEKQCKGVYVTHIKKLDEELPGVIGMVAVIEDDKWGSRTYKIERNAVDRGGYVDSIVDQYELEYDHIVSPANKCQ